MSEPFFLATIRKNSREDCRVALDEYEGRTLIDVRVWADFLAGPVAARCATKKGVALDVSRLPDLIAALEAARDEAERRGLI
jgi:hypothetical protein